MVSLRVERVNPPSSSAPQPPSGALRPLLRRHLSGPRLAPLRSLELSQGDGEGASPMASWKTWKTNSLDQRSLFGNEVQ